jgi:hypothetical protein
LTDGFVIEAVDAAEMILSRGGLPDVALQLGAPAFWLYPLGVTDDHLAQFRKQRQGPRGAWSVGDGPFAPVKLAPAQSPTPNNLKVSASLMEGHRHDDDDDDDEGPRSNNSSRRSNSGKASKSGSHSAVKEPVDSLRDFIAALERDEGLAAKVQTDLFRVASALSALPSLNDGLDKGDMRREYLVQRLVNHVYSSMK